MKERKYKGYLLAIKNQLIMLGILLLFMLLTHLRILPGEEILTKQLQAFFNTHGNWAVAIVSFLENIIGLGAYFPGSLVILAAMALSAGNIAQGCLTFLCIFLPAMMAQIINFFLGNRLSGSSKKASRTTCYFLLTTLWHPHFAAATSFTLGSQKLNFAEFFFRFTPIYFAWNLFWGITMFIIGSATRMNISFVEMFYIYLLLWILFDLHQYRKKL